MTRPRAAPVISRVPNHHGTAQHGSRAALALIPDTLQEHIGTAIVMPPDHRVVELIQVSRPWRR
jgi:hypothetical protein